MLTFLPALIEYVHRKAFIVIRLSQKLDFALFVFVQLLNHEKELSGRCHLLAFLL